MSVRNAFGRITSRGFSPRATKNANTRAPKRSTLETGWGIGTTELVIHGIAFREQAAPDQADPASEKRLVLAYRFDAHLAGGRSSGAREGGHWCSAETRR